MWDLFDFKSDGKTNLFEKVVGIELLEHAIHDSNTTFDDEEYDQDNKLDDCAPENEGDDSDSEDSEVENKLRYQSF